MTKYQKFRKSVNFWSTCLGLDKDWNIKIKCKNLDSDETVAITHLNWEQKFALVLWNSKSIELVESPEYTGFHEVCHILFDVMLNTTVVSKSAYNNLVTTQEHTIIRKLANTFGIK